MYCKKCDVCGEIYDFRETYTGMTPDEYEERTHSEVIFNLMGQDTGIDGNGEYAINHEHWHLCPKCTMQIFGRLEIMKKEASDVIRY